MGEYADMIINGETCQYCMAEYPPEPTGYPWTCADCKRDTKSKTPAKKATCPQCGKKVKAVGLAQHIKDAHKEEEEIITWPRLIEQATKSPNDPIAQMFLRVQVDIEQLEKLATIAKQVIDGNSMFSHVTKRPRGFSSYGIDGAILWELKEQYTFMYPE